MYIWTEKDFAKYIFKMRLNASSVIFSYSLGASGFFNIVPFAKSTEFDHISASIVIRQHFICPSSSNKCFLDSSFIRIVI